MSNNASDTCNSPGATRTFECPLWMKRGLMYQIFPDRFARDPAFISPAQNKEYIMREDWGADPVKGPDASGEVKNNDFFGGNLAGIRMRLPYLQELGVTVIYLNPIFEAYSNHRYDTADYMHIDPMLGTEEDLRSLCREAGLCGIRIVLDGVFNHTGSDSLYFNKTGRFPGVGAAQSRQSPYYSWYSFRRWPEEYDCWWGIKTLPAVNETAESYLNYMIRDRDSVVRHWLRAGIAGFRLDVVDELPDLFLEELRRAVKEENADAVIIGEVWENAATKVSYGQKRHYLDGTQLDSVMNYPLKDAIIRYSAGDGDAEAFGEAIEELRQTYPPTVFNGLMNILGTHDTERILTLLSEGVGMGQGKQRLFAALLIWALMPGIPCIYYGDEIGMEGGKDPENRRCFCPDMAKQDVAMHYRRILTFRSSVPEIEGMELEKPEADGGFLLLRRTGDSCCLLIAVNMGETERVFSPMERGDTAEGHEKTIGDFVIAGDVRFTDLQHFVIGPCSGVAVLLTTV